MPLYNPLSGANIVAGSVTTADLATGAVTSAIIADGTVTTTDISTASFDARYGVLSGATWTGAQDFTGATVTGISGGSASSTAAVNPYLSSTYR